MQDVELDSSAAADRAPASGPSRRQSGSQPSSPAARRSQGCSQPGSPRKDEDADDLLHKVRESGWPSPKRVWGIGAFKALGMLARVHVSSQGCLQVICYHVTSMRLVM